MTIFNPDCLTGLPLPLGHLIGLTIIIVVTVGTLSINEVTEARTEAIANMTALPSVTLTINAIASHRQNYKENNPLKEPFLSNLSSFITEDGVWLEARNNQVFQNTYKEE